ncbi:MAG: TolC family protein [Cyanobacteriota bacterium]|nr:TolC family protein [Cyanobacteriota bacterium]
MPLAHIRKLVIQRSAHLFGLFWLAAAFHPISPARSQGWELMPSVPTDVRDLLSIINKDSNLYLIYQQYRENRDGLQKAAERISLKEAIKRGVATSPELAQTVAKIQESEWNSVAINREWVPSLSLKTASPGVLGFTTTSTSVTTKTPGSSSQENISYKNGFQSNPYADLSWAFFDPSRGPRQAARDSRTESLRNRMTFTTRELIFQIQEKYTNLQEALATEKDLINLFDQILRVYIDAHKTQKPAGEVSRFEAQTVSLLLARIKAHKESIQAANALAYLINLQPGKLALPSEPPAVIPIWQQTRLVSIEQALLRREELRANALDVQALISDARAIRLRALPSLALSGQVQRQNFNLDGGSFNDDGPGTLTRSSGYTTFAGLTFDWKVFDGGIRNAEANATDAKARQTVAQGDLDRLQITREVTDAYASFVASRIQVDAARADVDASRRSFQSALADYAAGRHDDAGTTVVQSITKLQSALATYRNLVADQNNSVYKLYRLTSTWPPDTEPLLKAQYLRWLAPSAPANAPAAELPSRGLPASPAASQP